MEANMTRIKNENSVYVWVAAHCFRREIDWADMHDDSLDGKAMDTDYHIKNTGTPMLMYV